MTAGAAPLIVPVFLPHSGCPYRCVFCNQARITGQEEAPQTRAEIESWIDLFLKGCRPSLRRVQLAFYGGNFLGLPKSNFLALMDLAFAYVNQGKIHGIRFSTRPDTIDADRLDALRPYPVDVIEIGVQSMDDHVLRLCRRGHTADDTRRAVMRLKEKKYSTGLQLMVGLPGDDECRCLTSARDIADLSPDFIRIYPTVVLRDSPLAGLYETGRYTPWSLERCVSIVKEMVLLFRKKNIPVIRMGLQSSTDLDGNASILGGPYHPAFGHLVHSRIFLDKAVERLKAAGIANTGTRDVSICVHPRNISRLRGHRNENVQKIKQMFGLSTVRINSNPLLAKEDIGVTDRF